MNHSGYHKKDRTQIHLDAAPIFSDFDTKIQKIILEITRREIYGKTAKRIYYPNKDQIPVVEEFAKKYKQQSEAFRSNLENFEFVRKVASDFDGEIALLSYYGTITILGKPKGLEDTNEDLSHLPAEEFEKMLESRIKESKQRFLQQQRLYRQHINHDQNMATIEQDINVDEYFFYEIDGETHRSSKVRVLACHQADVWTPDKAKQTLDNIFSQSQIGFNIPEELKRKLKELN